MPIKLLKMKKSNILPLFLLLICMVCAHTHAYAQLKKNSTYQAYIDKYASMAIEQMNRNGIPASITLAQGLLESGAGTSMLATEANNHFGIKVGSGWTGPYVVRSDDKPNDKFRKYSSAQESYEDHSQFLKKPRYAKLFDLKITDYKGWAQGLKDCGYATSPTYATNLINIIELYNLTDYDRGQKSSSTGYQIATQSDKKVAKITQTTNTQQSTKREPSSPSSYTINLPKKTNDFFTKHPVYENNKNYYIRVQQGDNIAYIATQVGVGVNKLRKYNDLLDGMEPAVGSIIYLKNKRKRADRAFKNHPHVVTEGQSMYDIAQMYGIKLSSLYKLNFLGEDFVPIPGRKLRVY